MHLRYLQEPGDHKLKIGNATLRADAAPNGGATLTSDCQVIKRAAKWYRIGDLIKRSPRTTSW